MSDRVIDVCSVEEACASVAAPAAEAQAPEAQPVEAACLGTVAQTGSYVRRAAFHTDVDALDEDQRDLFAAYMSRTTQDHGVLRHLRLRDALVVGQGTVVTARSRLLRESAAEFLAHGRTPDGLLGLEEGRFALPAGREEMVDRPSLLLKRPWHGNYGHWLVDGAALAAMAARLALPAGWQVVVARQPSEGMRRVVLDTLERLLPGIEVAEHPDGEVWRFAELHYVSPVHVPPLFKLPEALSCLRALLLRGQLGAGSRGRRLYVARSSGHSRALANEAEVQAVCREFDLEVVLPETMTLLEQATLFHRAELVVGVKGAGLTNAVFCAAGAHVVALSPGDFPDPFFWDLVAQADINYSEIFGPLAGRDMPRGLNPFEVDVGKLRALLERCAA